MSDEKFKAMMQGITGIVFLVCLTVVVVAIIN